MRWGFSFLTFAYIQFVLLGAPTISGWCSSRATVTEFLEQKTL